jgi:hypothetical protein
MLDIIVYLILLTATSGCLFMVLKSAMQPHNAFLVSIVGTIVAVWILYGIREGADFQMNLLGPGIVSAFDVVFTPTWRNNDSIQVTTQNFSIASVNPTNPNSGKVWGYVRALKQ